MSRLPRLLAFDADGTLRWTTVSGQPAPNGPDEWRLFPDVRARLASIDWGPEGHLLGIASNQNGVALGRLSAGMAERLLRDTVEAAIGHLPWRMRIEMCICHPDAGCGCRKPAPGLLHQLLAHFALPPEDALFVGDLEIDRQAARSAGVPFVWAHDFFGRAR